MFKAESELEATPTHMEPLRAAEKQPSIMEHRRPRPWMPQRTEVSTLILAFLDFLVIFVNVSQRQMSHADPGQQQGDFRQTEGKCEREDGKNMAMLSERAVW